MGLLQQIWLCKIIGGMLLMCQNTTMWVYRARIKRYCVLCSETYSSSCTLVIASHWFATSWLGVPASVRLVYWISLYIPHFLLIQQTELQGSFCMCAQPMRRCYNVTSLIGWAHTQNDPWNCYNFSATFHPGNLQSDYCLNPRIWLTLWGRAKMQCSTLTVARLPMLWKIPLGYKMSRSHSPHGYWDFPVFSISLKYMASTKFTRAIDLQIQIARIAVLENI